MRFRATAIRSCWLLATFGACSESFEECRTSLECIGRRGETEAGASGSEGGAGDGGSRAGAAAESVAGTPDGGAGGDGGSPVDGDGKNCSWDEPFVRSVRLPAPFNLGTTGGGPNDSFWISEDSLTAYVSSFLRRNDFDIYETHRSTVINAFPTLAALTTVNTLARERQVSLSEDQLTLVYQNDVEILLTQRLMTAEPFRGATALPPPINEPGSISGEPFLDARAERIYFSSDRGGVKDFAIYVVDLSSVDPTVTKVVDQVGSYDGSPTLSPDELTLYYQAGRPAEVWVSHRESRDEPFTEGRKVDSLEAPVAQYPELVTADGCTLYYARGIAGSLEWFEGHKR